MAKGEDITVDMVTNEFKVEFPDEDVDTVFGEGSEYNYVKKVQCGVLRLDTAVSISDQLFLMKISFRFGLFKMLTGPTDQSDKVIVVQTICM